jgi:hypothetical protein
MGMISRPLKETIQDMLQVSEFDIEEIREGFSKQVYRIKTKKDRYILYIWRRPLENKLTENQTKGAKYLFPDGFKYFIHNTKLLTDMGIRVPAIIFSGHRDEEDFDYALVECFEGQSYMEYMNKGGDIRTVADKVEVVMEKRRRNLLLFRRCSGFRIRYHCFHGKRLRGKQNILQRVFL